MSRTMRESNVYYIAPQPSPAPLPPRPAGWTRLRQRATRTWWRLRLTLADIRAAIRRPGGRLFAADDYPLLLDRAVEVFAQQPPAPQRRAAGPARVIDFGAARGRLRAVPQQA